MKNFNKLSLAVLILGATLITFSFIPDMEAWKTTFSFEMKEGWECSHGHGLKPMHGHWHWNYKGWMWFLTGLVLTAIQIVRIFYIFKDKDFNE